MAAWEPVGGGVWFRPIRRGEKQDHAILVHDSNGWHLRLGDTTFNFQRYLLPEKAAKQRATRYIKAYDWEVC